MNFAGMYRMLALLLLLLPSFPNTYAQIDPEMVALGEWKAYLPYGGIRSIALSDSKIYAANGLSVFSLDREDNSFDRLHKANGLNDVNAVGVYYGSSQKTLVISYLNANVDFIIDGKIVGFPFIRTSTISGSKSVNHATFKGDSVYLSTGFGIVVYDIGKTQSPATYFFNNVSTGSFIKVNSTVIYNDSIYAATENGLYRAALSNPLLENFSNWTSINDTEGLTDGNARFVTVFNGQLYVVMNDNEIYYRDDDDWLPFLSEPEWNITHLDASEEQLMVILSQGDAEVPDAFELRSYDAEGNLEILDTDDRVSAPLQLLQDADGVYWIADSFGGLVALQNGNVTVSVPNGPSSAEAFDMEAFNGKLWVAPGAINASWQYTFNKNGFFVLDFGYWNNYNSFTYPALDTVFDFITMTLEASTEIAYFGSFGGGVVRFDRNTGSLEVFDHTNTGSSGLQDLTTDDPGSCRVGGMQLDVNGNLWVANYGAANPLVVRKSDGTWKNFDCDLPNSAGNQTGQIVIDDFDQKWVQLPKGNGILVYNHGADIDNTADDEKRTLSIGAGNGNLPVPFVNCLVKDLDGEIWVGTNEGVSIFYNPGSVMLGGAIGDASQPLVNLGGFNEFLLGREIVNCIAVDGANRKWIGTNSGVFLVSADGTEQLLFFNEDNSPLLSNIILSITIDGQTGEVFLGTDKGISSYRGTATQGTLTHGNVKVFPNPVRPEYTGQIAISGLVNNAQVKITDGAGRLIFETVALGGQAIWNGKGYGGNRAATGVYLVYSTDDTGKEDYVTKILFIQ